MKLLNIDMNIDYFKEIQFSDLANKSYNSSVRKNYNGIS